MKRLLFAALVAGAQVFPAPVLSEPSRAVKAATSALMPSTDDTSAGSEMQVPCADSSFAVASQSAALRDEM